VAGRLARDVSVARRRGAESFEQEKVKAKDEYEIMKEGIQKSECRSQK
jgi:hypothetical protein